ncbi:MAG: four helix bundle protein [Planctomycetota bacterium]|jgi:four helix bundle protein
MAIFKFEELKVYQLSLNIVDEVYALTNKYPKDELYGLVSQFRRASVSIALNIAEGSGSTDKNFNRYLGIANDSLKECIVCLTISKRRNYISSVENEKQRDSLLVIAKMITNLRKYLNKEK